MKKALCSVTKAFGGLAIGVIAALSVSGCNVSVSGESAPAAVEMGNIQTEAVSSGFSISGRKIYDANGNEFIMRGVSHAHVWYTSQLDNALVGIKATGANTVRIVLGNGVQWTKASAAEVAGIIEKCKNNKLIAMLEVHDTTGYGEASAACSLATAVNYWKEIKSALDGQEKYVMVNIGNEPYGNNNTGNWQADTQNAIIALRAAGFKHTIVVDAPNWGQDWSGTMKNSAAAVFNSDQDKNTILSVHMYESYTTDSTIYNYLNAFKNANLPLIVGEFGCSNNGNYVDADDIMKECVAFGVGYLAWSWCGNSESLKYLDMVNNWNNASLTTWGNRAINGVNGIKSTAVECTVFNSNPVSSASTQSSAAVSSKSSVTSTAVSSAQTSSKPDGVTSGLKVQTFQSGSAIQNQVYEKIILVNTTGTSIPLSTIKIRYYFKYQGTTGYSFSCDYSPIGSANVNNVFAALSPAQTGADAYNEISFSSSAGSIAANATVELQCRVWKNDWSNIDNSLNYSYNPATAYTDWNKLTIYQNGALVWGIAPGGTVSSSSIAVSSSSRSISSSLSSVISSSSSIKSSSSSSSSSIAVSSSKSSSSISSIISSSSVASTSSQTVVGNVKIQTYQNGAAVQNQVYLKIKVVNTSTSAVALSTVKARYYYANQGTSSYSFGCDWTPVGTANVSAAFAAVSPAKPGADSFIELSFSAAAGSVAAGASIEIQGRMWRNDWANIDNSLNYSYNPATAYTDWNKVTAFQNGVLVWGVAPGGSSSVSTVSSVSSLSSTPVSSSKSSSSSVVVSSSVTSSSVSSSASVGFVKVQNGRFMRDGKAYYYIGANFWQGMNLGSKSTGGDRAKLTRELDRMKAAGIRNLRIMAGSEGPDGQPWRANPALQTSPGIYNNDLLDGLDYLLSEMKKRDMTAVMCLNNFWHWSGGMAQYVSWAEGSSIPYPPPAANGNWDTFQAYSAKFYNNSSAVQWFKNHINKIVNRVNTYTGVAYKNDPTIFSWQLANEPRGMTVASAFNSWINSTSQYIKSMDANHMVTTGCEGETPYQSYAGLDFKLNHSYSGIDYMTVHLWVENWGWYSPTNPNGTYASALSQGLNYIQDHITKANQVGKPMVLEEFGLARDNGALNAGTPTTWRDSYYSSIFDKIFQSASTGNKVDGANFWAWSGESRPLHQYWTTGDPFLGDPTHEPQGWYGVYDTDASTLSVIQNYAAKMNGIN